MMEEMIRRITREGEGGTTMMGKKDQVLIPPGLLARAEVCFSPLAKKDIVIFDSDVC